MWIFACPMPSCMSENGNDSGIWVYVCVGSRFTTRLNLGSLAQVEIYGFSIMFARAMEER